MTTTPDPTLNEPSSASPSVVGTRPFGAHLSMRWWVPVVLTIVFVSAIHGLQLILGGIAALVEFGLLGKDPDDASLTPLTFLAINLSIILVAEVRAVLADGESGPVRGLLEVEEDGQAGVGVRLIRQGHREVRRTVHHHVLTAPLDPHAGRRSPGPHRRAHRHRGTGVQREVPNV